VTVGLLVRAAKLIGFDSELELAQPEKCVSTWGTHMEKHSMTSSSNSSATASTRSPKAQRVTSEKPYRLTPSEIESLRQDSIKAMAQLMK